MSDELAEADLRSDAEYEQLASSTGPLPPTNVYRKAKWAIGEIDALKARVDLLTTALTGLVARCDQIDAEHQAKPFNDGETGQIDTAEVRAVLAATPTEDKS